MNRDELRTIQAPLKKLYREHPIAAMYTLRAEGRLEENVSCRVLSNKDGCAAGLHPATGGDARYACSGNLLLESLVACAGVTLQAVAASAGFELMGGKIKAEGDLDFRGTLGNKDVPVGFQAIRLNFELITEEAEDRLLKLIELSESYCVVFQTLKSAATLETKYTRIKPERN